MSICLYELRKKKLYFSFINYKVCNILYLLRHKLATIPSIRNKFLVSLFMFFEVSIRFSLSLSTHTYFHEL